MCGDAGIAVTDQCDIDHVARSLIRAPGISAPPEDCGAGPVASMVDCNSVADPMPIEYYAI